jgi:hypothetical protein
MGPHPLALAAVLALAACASVSRPAAPAAAPDPAASARAADDAALADAAAELAPLQEHFAAVAGGRFLGATMLVEDAARLLEGAGPAPGHAYLFLAGTEGNLRVPIPALFGDRVAGRGLLDALGLTASLDPDAGTLTLRRGADAAAFVLKDGIAAANFVVAPASGRGKPWQLPLAVAPEFSATALVSRADAAALGLVLSEIPGEASLVEALTGRSIPCRRALCRVTFPFPGEGAGPPATALLEVLFPK